MTEIVVIRTVAEVATCNNEGGVVAAWMPFWQQVIPGQGQPIVKRGGSVQSAVSAFETVAL
jgi:hypothetical protein